MSAALYFVKPEISIGEIVLSLSTLGAAWYVGSALKRKQDRDLAARDLVRFFCRESLQLLATASDTFATELARTHGAFDLPGAVNIKAALQRLSNSIHTIRVAVEAGNLKESKSLIAPDGPLRALLEDNENLRTIILDPLADASGPPVNPRTVEGALSQMRETIVRFELGIISRLE